MATEKRLIELDYVVDHLQPVLNDTTCPIHIAAEIDEIIGTAPTVDAVEVVHGRWVHDSVGFDDFWTCSACGEDWFFIDDPEAEYAKVNYCPNCCAKMDGDGNAAN